MADSKLIEKIRKLMALSKSPNEHEAQLAAEKAQALLAEHNLSMSEISKEEQQSSEFEIDKDFMTESVPWRRRVCSAVAKLYFCDYFFAHFKQPTSRRQCGYIRYDHHCFVGEAHNIQVAKLMSEYLMDAVDRLAQEGARTVTTRERSRYLTSFRHAASIRLRERLNERRKQTMEQGVQTESGTTLPALANMYQRNALAIQNYLQGRVDLRTHKSRITQSHMGGVRDGDAAGRSIGLERQVGGRGSKHLLR